MKKIVFKTLMIAVAFSGFTACSNDDDDKNGNGNNSRAIVINGGITTKVTDTQWESGDAIGVTMYESDYSSIVDQQFNKRYVTTGTLGVFNGGSRTDSIYFPQDGRTMRLKSYYPYDSQLGSDMLKKMVVTDQLVLQNIDLMTAEHQSGFSKTDSNVKLHFYHRMSKLIFVMSLEDESDNVSLADCQLIIEGIEETDTYDLFNDVFLNDITDPADISVPHRNNERTDIRQAIVLPREAAQGVVFRFVRPDGGYYVANMSSALALEGGNQYTFNVTLAKNPVTVTATIEQWIDNDPEYYIAR